MRIGIVSQCMFSMFSGGTANNTIAFLELFSNLGHDVSLLNTHSSEWFDDCKSLKSKYKVVQISKDQKDFNQPFDLLIELIPYFDNEQQRKKFGKQSILVFRKNMLIPIIENSLYPILLQKYNFDGIDHIWTFDVFSNSDEIQILETLSKKKVVQIPYIWTPSIIESHKEENQMPIWLQVQNFEADTPWKVHVCETNTTSCSSCTIPLCTIRQAKLTNFNMENNYKIHNSEHLLKSQFFKENIMKHNQVADLSGQYVGRQRLIDFVYEPKSCIISHVRFIPFKPMLFDLAWLGIPFIHNSEVFKSIASYGRYYYPNNSISSAVECLHKLSEDFKNKQGCFNIEQILEFRKYILENYFPGNERIMKRFSELLNVESSNEKVIEKCSSYVLLFTDMWENFNPTYNFFTLLLKNSSSVNIEFYDENTLPSNVKPNAVLFGPFGTNYKNYPNVPKIHFTGENTPPVDSESVKLNLGFKHADMVGDEYLRFPLWILEIDWFNCDLNKIANPKPIPLDRCVNVYMDEPKDKFCAFVVSNPNNDIRNKAFLWLNQYKPVDSAGRVMNTLGEELFAGLGGGGGELKKLEFLKNYKFCITYENSSSQGYVTEKLLHAKAAGCIPIYWGDPKVERDFNTKGLIDARGVNTPEELINLVRNVDSNSELYDSMRSVPALDDYKVDWARRTMAECARRMLMIITSKNIEVPRFVGQKTNIIVKKSNTVETPIMVTYATRLFLPSLNQWLSGLEAQRKSISDIRAIVFLGSDVPDESKKKLLETFSFVEFRYLPSETPEHFSDIWSPEHYAWKIYIYQHLANDKSLKDKMIFYSDSGSFLCRWPSEYLKKTQDNDICVLEDDEQYNEQWCHAKSVELMNINSEELKQQQIVGGILAFRAGSEKVISYFNEAWKYAQMRDVIVGEKWEGTKNSKPFGHRHDQSILSILSLRHELAKYPLHNIYCDTSLRKTFLTNKHLYVHRGNFKIHEQFLNGIDDCFVINLKRRSDRLERLYSSNPELKNKVLRVDAFEGKKLVLTPSIARLFKPHDFMWKKAIMGCALSHLSLWYQLATERPDINSYLILEDDAKLNPIWQETWAQALPHLPENYDVIFLGGILPPNRAGFETVKEPINKYFSRVKENNFFGQNPPNRYFHFCAYAYVLSKQGAQKILSTIVNNDGYYTSADHMVCNRVDLMNIYFLDPLVAGCYQDDDPVYKNSDFNNFNRVDGFDSDLWNNDERFSEKEITAVGLEGKLDIAKALFDARNSVNNHVEEKKSIIPIQTKSTRFYTLDNHKVEWNHLYEKTWLNELFGKPKTLEFNRVSFNEVPQTKDPIFFVQRGQIEDYSRYFQKLEAKGIDFYVLHLSDEHGNDNIDFYELSHCKKIVRNYVRNGLSDKVLIIPLGYHNTFSQGMENPFERTPQLPFRSQVWSFFGTDWNNRSAILEPYKIFQPHKSELFNEWNHPKSLDKKEYLSILLDTVFVPCIGGNNLETFRLYEALECGCIPILVKEGNNEQFIKYINQYLQLIVLEDWSQGVEFIQQLLNNKESLEQYRFMVLKNYQSMKGYFKGQVQEFLKLV